MKNETQESQRAGAGGAVKQEASGITLRVR